MGTVIKTYTAFILVLMTVFISVGILAVMLDVQNARDYHAACVNEIENSNHSPSVIAACKTDAENNTKNNYKLEVESFTNSSGNYTFSVSKVVLTYTYRIPFLNIESEKEIVGYAR